MEVTYKIRCPFWKSEPIILAMPNIAKICSVNIVEFQMIGHFWTSEWYFTFEGSKENLEDLYTVITNQSYSKYVKKQEN